MLRVILNPASRGGAGRAVHAEIERELQRRGLQGDVVETRAPGDAAALAYAACAEGVSTVVAAGGDGTVHEVANGLLRAADEAVGLAPNFGVIPVGTGNDFVKVVPGTSTRHAAYDTLASGVARPFDVIRATWQGGSEYAVNAVGTGVDVEVVRQIQASPRRTGALVYIGGLVRALRRYRPVHLRIEADGATVEQRVMMIALANGSCIGGLFRVCPRASPTDGWLDLCVVGALPAWQQPGLAARVLRGTHERQPSVSTLSFDANGAQTQIVLVQSGITTTTSFTNTATATVCR